MKKLNQSEYNGFSAKSSGRAYLFCFVYTMLFTALFSKILLEEQNFYIQMLSYVLMQLVFVSVFITVVKCDKINIKTAFNFKKTASWLNYLVCVLLSIAIILLMKDLINIFEYLVKESGYKGGAVEINMNSIGDLFLAIFVIAVIPAIIEEIIFRGIIYEGLRELGATTAVVLSSVCFMLMHGGIYQTIFQLVLGFVFVMAYKITRDLKLAMVMHFVNNTFILVYSYFVKTSALTKVLAWQAVLAVVLFALGILAIYFWLYIMKKINKNSEEKEVPPNKNANKTLLIVSICVAIFIYLYNVIGGYFI